MLFSLASTAALAGLAIAAPNNYPISTVYDPFPLADGFPNPSASQVRDIEKRAGGTLPNGPFPPNPNSPAAALDLQVIAFNEIFEVAYFNQLLHNVTSGVKGYEVPSKYGKDYIVKLLKEIIAQEELHALLANAGLKAYGGKAIVPAKYQFPVSNLKDAFNFAGLFTSLVLGALQSVEVDLASVKAVGLVQVVASIIGQEGEQTGFYRSYTNLVPSAAPFLTVAAGQFAYNALLQNVIVPGSNPNQIGIPVYDPLTLVSKPAAKDSTITYSVKTKTAPTTANYITYVSGQNVPVSVAIRNIKSKGNNKYTFEASFPYTSQRFAHGLTVASLTKSKGYADVAAVAAGTTAGPGLIYLN